MPQRQAAQTPRPRNSRATKELLLAAATEEFSEYGFAGARIDRIAQRARANKRLLYAYFGDKNRLFEVVMERQIEALRQAVPFTGDDLAADAAARFDYVLANPRISRLATWRAFERAEPTAAERRSYATKVAAVAAAQRDGKIRADIPAIDLIAMVLRLTESWLSAPPALKAVAGSEPMSPKRLRQHRAALVEAVRSLTQPRVRAVK